MDKKILVVDDDLFIREIYVDALKNNGFEVDSAQNGKEGLGKLKQGGFDLILLDFHMPEMNAPEILDAISANPPTLPNGPIVLLTNTGEDEDIKKALQKGAKTFLIKTDMTPKQLVEEVANLLNQ